MNLTQQQTTQKNGSNEIVNLMKKPEISFFLFLFI